MRQSQGQFWGCNFLGGGGDCRLVEEKEHLKPELSQADRKACWVWLWAGWPGAPSSVPTHPSSNPSPPLSRVPGPPESGGGAKRSKSPNLDKGVQRGRRWQRAFILRSLLRRTPEMKLIFSALLVLGVLGEWGYLGCAPKPTRACGPLG